MNDRTFTLADSFDATDRLRVDMTAPLPLGHTQAVARALALRAKGNRWSYAVIAVVMAEYHGFKRSEYWWRHEIRMAGAPSRLRGVPFGQERAAA